MPFKFNPFTKKPDYYEEASVPGITKGWELIKTGTFTNDIDITGLDGNVDKLYRLIIKARHTAAFYLPFRFNGDASTSYESRFHFSGIWAAAGVHGTTAYTAETKIYFGSKNAQSKIGDALIQAESGQVRLINIITTQYTDKDNFVSEIVAGYWLNTVDNIITINIIPGAITAGEYWLFRKKE